MVRKRDFAELDPWRMGATRIPSWMQPGGWRVRLRTKELGRSALACRRGKSGKLNTGPEKILNYGGIPFTMRRNTRKWNGRVKNSKLSAAQDNQTDFGGHAQAYGCTNGAEAAVDVEVRHGGRLRGEERWAEGSRRARRARGGRGAVPGNGRKKRTVIEAGDVVGYEARGAETMVEDLHLDLTAVSVTRERELDAQLGGAMERIGIVRSEE